MATGSAAIVLVMATLGYLSPLLSRYFTHFSYDEQHTTFELAPPGAQDISLDHPTFDGDATTFDYLDTDDSGYLECTRTPIGTRVLPGMKLVREITPSLAGEIDERLDLIDEKLPLSAVLRHLLGPVECPELDRARGAMRFFTFLVDDADGRSAPPDGVLTPDELPDDFEISARYHALGVRAEGLFAMLDRDGDGGVERWELVDVTRYLRHDKVTLLDRFDADMDLRISRAEYPGAPEVHTFWLGTDPRGRDLLTRLLYGARISISIGLLATLVSFLIGVTWGGVAGYFGGRTDLIMMAIVDVLYGLPFMFIVILLIVVAGRSTINLFIALGCVQWLTMSRVVRGQVLSLKKREFVEAARAIGVKGRHIIRRHILPNTVGPVIVYSTLMVPAVILEEAFLSFLGLGVQPPDPSWGNLISEGAMHIEDHPWLILYPGIALGLTLFCLNFLGDGVRDALDPQMQKS